MAQALSPTALSSMTAPSSHRRKSAYLTRKTSAPYEPLSTHWETALSKQLTTTLCGPSLSVRSNSVTAEFTARDRKSTRLNSSHGYISYAVFCLKKKKSTKITSNLIAPQTESRWRLLAPPPRSPGPCPSCLTMPSRCRHYGCRSARFVHRRALSL